MANPVKLAAQVKQITPFGKGVYKVEFSPERRIPRYNAGQFLHLTVDYYDPMGGFWPESRVFSISSPYSPDSLSIIYSVKGKYTKKMEDTLKVGTKVWLKLPYGEFIIDENTTDPIVLIAGGTGISPFLPFLEHCFKEGYAKQPLFLFYGLRSIEALPAEYLLTKRDEVKNFKLFLKLEQEPSDKSIPYSIGILDIDEIIHFTFELENAVYYLSGPPVMIMSFKNTLLQKGVNPCNIRIDEWE